MPIVNQDLADIINELRQRIYALELASYTYADPSQAGRSDLNITGLTGNVAYYLDGSGNQRAEVTFSWTAPATPDPDNLAADPVVDYMMSITRSTDATTGLFYSTNGQTTVKINNLPIGVNITGRVFAISKNGVHGNTVSTTVVITKDTTPPPQPSTPVLVSKPNGVQGTYDGKDNLGAAMPSDFSHCIVQTSTDNVTFTSTDIVQASGTFFILANSNYDRIYVRLLSVDKDGNVNSGVPSTVANALPTRLTGGDLGVVFPGDIGFNDVDNLVTDGSFENALIRANRTANSGKVGTWSYTNTAGLSEHGNWALSMVGDATVTKYYYLHDTSVSQANEFLVIPGNKLYLRSRIRGVSSNGVINLAIRFRDKSGGLTYSTVATKSDAPTGQYETLEGVIVVPESAVTAAPYFTTSNVTTGTVYFDSIQVKNVISSTLIEDAAITRAKIDDLAVGSQQVEEVDAGLIKSGFILADRIGSDTITTRMIAIGAVTLAELNPSVGTELPIGSNPALTDKASNAVVDNIQTAVTTLSGDLSPIKNSIIIDGNGINISKQGSPFQITIDNDSLDFKEGQTIVAYVNGQKMYIKSAEILQQLTVGVHVIEKYDVNNTFIRWAG